MSLEKDALRKAAGLSFDTKRKSLFEGNVSKVRTLDIEAELLRIFTGSIRDIKRLRDIMEGNYNSYYGINGGNSYRLKDESGEIDKKYLFKLATEKLDLMKESLKDCFSIKDEVSKESDEEDSNDDDDDDE